MFKKQLALKGGNQNEERFSGKGSKKRGATAARGTVCVLLTLVAVLLSGSVEAAQELQNLGEICIEVTYPDRPDSGTYLRFTATSFGTNYFALNGFTISNCKTCSPISAPQPSPVHGSMVITDSMYARMTLTTSATIGIMVVDTLEINLLEGRQSPPGTGTFERAWHYTSHIPLAAGAVSAKISSALAEVVPLKTASVVFSGTATLVPCY
jgi:hypothetical protein